MGFGRLDLSFESATALFTELTPACIDLLEALRQCGPCSVTKSWFARTTYPKQYRCTLKGCYLDKLVII